MSTELNYMDTEISRIICDLKYSIKNKMQEEYRGTSLEYLSEMETRIKGLINNINNKSVLPFDF